MFETNGPVKDLYETVAKTPGLEWLADEDLRDLAPNEDSFVADKPDKPVHAQLYLVLFNQQAVEQMLSLWRSWSTDARLPEEHRVWLDVFRQSREIRRWGVRDRLEDIGILAYWRDRVAARVETVSVELELWFRQSEQRAAVEWRVRNFVTRERAPARATSRRTGRPSPDRARGSRAFAQCRRRDFRGAVFAESESPAWREVRAVSPRFDPRTCSAWLASLYATELELAVVGICTWVTSCPHEVCTPNSSEGDWAAAPVRIEAGRSVVRLIKPQAREASMLQLRPNCECCDQNLAGDSDAAYICSFECTFCARCASERFAGKCPNCAGELVRRPQRPAEKLARYPASTERVFKHEGCAKDATSSMECTGGL